LNRGVRCDVLTQFDCDIPFQFVLETNRLNAGDGLDDRGFTVGYVSDGANVDGGLA
jgi:hypothetical protein